MHQENLNLYSALEKQQWVQGLNVKWPEPAKMMQITIVDSQEKNESALTQKTGDQMESLKQ